MSAGNLALIACIPGLGLMLLAVEASGKIKGPGLDSIRRMITSMGFARLSSDHNRLELCCSFASKQQTLQDSNHYMAEMENTTAVHPGRHRTGPIQAHQHPGHKTRWCQQQSRSQAGQTLCHCPGCRCWG